MTQKIYRFEVSGRNGSLESVFAATEEQIAWIIGKDIYFGEVWGKHSEVVVTMKSDDYTMVTDDAAAVKMFKETIKVTGYCPFDYLDDEQGDEFDALFSDGEEESS
jgi:hypothetical protein